MSFKPVLDIEWDYIISKPKQQTQINDAKVHIIKNRKGNLKIEMNGREKKTAHIRVLIFCYLLGKRRSIMLILYCQQLPKLKEKEKSWNPSTLYNPHFRQNVVFWPWFPPIPILFLPLFSFFSWFQNSKPGLREIILVSFKNN